MGQSDSNGPPVPPDTERYAFLGMIARGGMAGVHRVLDQRLNCVVAMKIIHPGLLEVDGALGRFMDEARATARLAHPGIVPIHDMGRLPDGRGFFTMKVVEGRTLREVIREAHGHAPERDVWSPGAAPVTRPWELRRLVEALLRVCEAVAYAHSQGVLHRDLKPENIMLGAWREVLVMDWGLSIALASGGGFGGRQLAGTPAYMSPEQARGDGAALTLASDVYALGAILFELLSGSPPYEGTVSQILDEVVRGRRPPLFGPQEIPRELRVICDRAMEPTPRDRYTNAGAMAEALESWLLGMKAREQALEIIQRADSLWPRIDRLREQARRLRQEARTLLDPLPPWADAEEKQRAWSLQDEAARFRRKADLLEVEATQLLRGALTHAPGLPEGHSRLARLYRDLHAQAEAAHDQDSAARSEALLRDHDRGEHALYLKGDGAVTLITDPPGAEVALFRFERRKRRLVPVFVRTLGKTPLDRISIPQGSYLMKIRAEGYAETSYPVMIGRQKHWDGVPPGASSPAPIRLLRPEVLGDDVYVPAGWFTAGGDPRAGGSPMANTRFWMDGFVIQRFQVTNEDYLTFLQALVRADREEDALVFAPRQRLSTAEGVQGQLLYGRTEDGGFCIKPDAQGDLWALDWPIMHIPHHAAVAYTAWRAERDGQPWRLPWELEWEKGCRGVDRRSFPWGDHFDPTWARMRFSTKARLLPVSIHEYPTDESPYGVRGMSGNIVDWCLDSYRAEGPPLRSGRPMLYMEPTTEGRVTLRGGAWSVGEDKCRGAYRTSASKPSRSPVLGFRCVFSLT